MILVDARRLTGPNHIARTPLVIVEVTLEGAETIEQFRALYTRELARMRAALGLAEIAEAAMLTRPHRGGCVVAYLAPLDVMLACAEISEWAATSVIELFAKRPPLPLEPKQAEIAAMLKEQSSPRLLELQAEAWRRNLPLQWDDETLTLGMGIRSASFPIMPRASLPDVEDVAWDSLGRIPVVLITGTNGKTTSSRLLARVAKEAGFHVGVASTGGVAIDGRVLETGDWTGPAAARMVLARKDVDFAVLETARGGILRRGLAVDTCDVALITNVSDDHLGLYGIDDIDAMVHVKATVARAVSPSGTCVLSAEDPRLATLAASLPCKTSFFGLQKENDRTGVFVSEGRIMVGDSPLIRVDEIPITFGGAAEYNIRNVLGVVATATALGLPRDAMARALRSFDMADNPGRGQLTEHRGVRIMLDFGHNPDSVRGVMQLVTRLRDARAEKGKLTVVTGSPGDRPDRELADVCAAIWEARPDKVLVRELGNHLRGRAPMEVPGVFRRELTSRGLPETSFDLIDSEVAALSRSLADASPGDFVVILVHVEEAATRAFLSSL